ncbi:ABC transporter ATP-binding protein [Flavobacterium aquiphilum]|uniref:ABC transporter ATP-binding protein n=1 Tax=Flavobacterium aquiphilum TaxID=3003261 RepID=UPI0024811AFB|nr:ABC transporter ATP-binding protein [Flavobacterium aquiphilum]
MKDIILKAENISKQYRLGQVGTGTLSHDLNRWWHQLRGKEDPYLKVGDTNDRSTKGESEYVWALQDINFEVERGEVLGIIGKNGAGKSTLLKILSKVTAPTTGSIKSRGRIASLLEVGTGFNGEMTGRENIYLNGAILGMTKREITSKLGEIIDFSGCERYIDTPVKRYSSGMTVRLAFAVAAFLEPEILVIDEVLAVGDAEFQKKAIGKMQDISKGEGRTVLFVSHNMGSIASLCKSGIYMENGKIIMQDHISKIIDSYISSNSNSENYKCHKEVQNYISDVEILNKGVKINQFGINDEIQICIEVIYENILSTKVGVALLDRNKNKVFTTHFDLSNISNARKKMYFTCNIPSKTICPGLYSFDVALFNTTGILYDYVSDICQITVLETGSDMYFDNNYGNVFVNCKWDEKY